MKINGRELAVEVEGEGPAVLLVHGLGGTTNYYQPLSDALSERFTVIRVDSAGAGRSELADGLSVASHADDLAAVLDSLGIASAAVVGHSMGTLVVRELAVRYPEKVSKLVLLGAVRAPGEEAQKAQRDRASLVREQGTAVVAPGVIANALSQSTREQRPATVALVRELIMRQDDEGYARNCEALAGATDPGPVASALPLLLITGSDDKVGPPEASEELAAAHGNARVDVLPDIGHWTAVEAVSEVNELLSTFL